MLRVSKTLKPIVRKGANLRMNKIIKILNHNAILVHDQVDNQTLLIMHTGIGFGRKINDFIVVGEMDQIYHIQDFSMSSKDQSILKKMNPLYLEISHDLLSLYQSEFGSLDEGKLIPLADHIGFAIERIKSDITISNPFSNEIRLLYPQEWAIARQAREIIFNKLAVLINDDEIGYITLHLHASQEISKDHGFIVAMIVNKSIRQIESQYNIIVDMNSLSYSRLMIHMKFMIARLNEDEILTLDMEDYTKASIPTAYEVAKNIVDSMSEALGKNVPEIEIGYLAMHMDRILADSKSYQSTE